MHERTGPGWRILHATYQETLAACEVDGGADLIAFSPPYCDARTYGADVSWTDADYAALGDAVFPALKPGGHALVNVDAPVREWRKGFGTERGFHPWRLMLDWAERVGFRVPDRLAFGRQGLPGHWPDRFRNDWEPLLWFQRPGVGWMDTQALTEPARWPRGARADSATFRAPDGEVVRKKRTAYTTIRRGTWWQYGVVGGGQTGAPDIEAQNHPARWPFRLAEDIVRCFCPVGGLVCDPFTGAGTTGAAAIAHGRRFLGGDLYARTDDGKLWADVAADALTDRQRQQKFF